MCLLAPSGEVVLTPGVALSLFPEIINSIDDCANLNQAMRNKRLAPDGV
jgi:hypothetical protein